MSLSSSPSKSARTSEWPPLAGEIVDLGGQRPGAATEEHAHLVAAPTRRHDIGLAISADVGDRNLVGIRARRVLDAGCVTAAAGVGDEHGGRRAVLVRGGDVELPVTVEITDGSHLRRRAGTGREERRRGERPAAVVRRDRDVVSPAAAATMSRSVSPSMSTRSTEWVWVARGDDIAVLNVTLVPEVLTVQVKVLEPERTGVPLSVAVTVTV